MEEMKLTNVVQTFESIFDEMGIDVSHEASLYYVTLICHTPESFTEMHREARRMRKTISERALKNGRSALMGNGLIAQVLFVHGSDTRFGTEPYLPVNPRIVAEVHNEYLKEVYSDEDFSIRNRDVGEIHRIWMKNFGIYGIGIEKGSVTLHYADTWVMYTLLGIIGGFENTTISMMLGGIDVFKEAYKAYYSHIIQQGSKIRAIIDKNDEAEDVKRLKREYGGKIEAKYIPREHYGTCRQILFNHDLALDGKELLLSDRSGPSCIGTIYMREADPIALLRNNFEDIWKTHSPR
jgi:hypothetical protein